jgi:uncharacterized protein YceK
MKIAIVGLAVACLLTGCISIHMDDPKPGQFGNYREMLYRRMEIFQWKDVPATVQAKVRTCAVDSMMPYITPAELEHLDAYARGEAKMSDSEIAQFDRDLQSRMGGKDGGLEAMKRTCPETVKEAEKYKS